jgi:hypothetical protein
MAEPRCSDDHLAGWTQDLDLIEILDTGLNLAWRNASRLRDSVGNVVCQLLQFQLPPHDPVVDS